MGPDRETEHSTTSATPVLDASCMFPRLELPPVPGFRAPAQEPDAPAWQSPYADVVDPELQYRAMVERVAAMSDARAEAREPATELAPSPVPPPLAYMPELQAEPSHVQAKPSAAAIGVLLVTAGLLVWASQMAFSPALLALAGLLIAQLAVACAAAPRAGKRPLVLGGVAVVLALLAAKGGIHGFSDTAFVAGLFVLVAVLAALVLFGALQLLLRRGGEAASPLDLALRSGWRLRVAALVGVLGGGVQAHRTFSAVPDAIVTLLIVGVVVALLLPLVRGGSDRPA